MPYLSRIWLNPLRSQTQRLLRNPQAAHAAILSGLSLQPVSERVLWRWEPDRPHRAPGLAPPQTRAHPRRGQRLRPRPDWWCWAPRLAGPMRWP